MNEVKLLNKTCIAIIFVCIVGIAYTITTFALKTPVLAEEMIAKDGEENISGLFIPIAEGTNTDDVFVTSTVDFVNIIIPSEDKSFYKENSLKGDSGNISELKYGYIDGNHIFDISFSAPSECIVDKDVSGITVSIDKIRDKYDTVIVIDPAHGGEDSGSISYSVNESYVNYNTAVMLRDRLSNERTYVAITRSSSTNPAKDERDKVAEDLDADLYIRISCNADERTRVSNGMEFAENANAQNRFDQALENAFPEIKKMSGDESVVQRPVLEISLGYLTNKMDALTLSDQTKLGEITDKLSEVIRQN